MIEIEIVGIDWGRKFHYCYFLNAKKKLVIKNKEEEFVKLLKVKDAVFAIEDSNNRIVDYLVNYERTVNVISSKKSKEARKYHVTEGKSDQIDSIAIAKTYRDNPGWFNPVKREGISLELGTLLGEYTELNKTATQDLGRLDAKLERYWPEVKEIFNYSTTRTLGFLTICPTAKDFLCLTDKEIIKKMKELHFKVDSFFRKGLKKLRNSLKAREVPKSVRRSILRLSQYAMEKKLLKSEIKKELKTILKKSKYKVILTIPGINVMAGSLLVVAFLTHRFVTFRDFQKYAGTTPVYYGSGQKTFTKMRYNCNHYLRGILHMAMMSSIKKSSWMRTYYLKKKNEGKKHALALRALANIILKIAFAMLRDLTPYSEELYNNRNSNNNYTSKVNNFSEKGGVKKSERSLKALPDATCQPPG
ncbi:MAG: transposase [Kosmotogaceae bacterium]